jgi:hypothetical protein
MILTGEFFWKPDYSYVDTDTRTRSISIGFQVTDDTGLKDSTSVMCTVLDRLNPDAIKQQFEHVVLLSENLEKNMDKKLTKLKNIKNRREKYKKYIIADTIINGVAAIALSRTNENSENTKDKGLVVIGMITFALEGFPLILYPEKEDPKSKIKVLRLEKIALLKCKEELISKYGWDPADHFFLGSSGRKLKKDLEELNKEILRILESLAKAGIDLEANIYTLTEANSIGNTE